MLAHLIPARESESKFNFRYGYLKVIVPILISDH